MRFGVYVLFMLGFAIAFMLAGKTNALFYLLGVEGYGPSPESTAVVEGTGTIDAPGFTGVPINLKVLGARFVNILISPTSIGILVGGAFIAGGLALFTGGLTGGIAQQLTSFAAVYLVPIVMFFFFANMLIIPVDQYLQQANCPGNYASATNTTEYTQCQSAQMPGAVFYPLLAIYNIAGILALITFYKGAI